MGEHLSSAPIRAGGFRRRQYRYLDFFIDNRNTFYIRGIFFLTNHAMNMEPET